jgi:hypothetical protein
MEERRDWKRGESGREERVEERRKWKGVYGLTRGGGEAEGRRREWREGVGESGEKEKG